MKSRIYFIAMFSLCMFTATAQHQLSGTVKDETNGFPVPYATIALLRPDSSAITGVMTGNDGKFIMQNVLACDYILQVSFIGYKKTFRRITIPAQSDLGNIILTESTTRMQEVVITADRPLVTMKADRFIVNVSGNIQNSGRNALDILRNTPGVLVTQNGDISILGNSVQVWIDGRPSLMSSEQLQAFLNSMQGGEIDRIEVITNPSSRYDAEGSGGIIDIRTKKGLQYGLNGTLTAGYRQGRTDRENAGVNLNWRREKFNFFGNYTAYRTTSWEQINQINVIQTSTDAIEFDQNTISKTIKPSLQNQYRVGIDYFINSKNIMGIIANGNFSNSGSTALRGVTKISPAYNDINYSEAENIRSSNSNDIQVNMNYQSMFSKQGQQLDLDFDFAHFNYVPLQQITNRYYNPSRDVISNPEQLRNTNPQITEIYSTKIDYTQPLWKNARAEMGAKASQSKTDNDLKYEEFGNGYWEIDTNRTNRFILSEQISAAYININQRLGKFSLQAGLRGEYTRVEGKQKTTSEVNDTTYFNIFPTFFVNYQISPKHTLGISYSRRISRPDYSYLNPFEITLDAYSFSVGNPYLTPSYTHNVQLSYMFGQSLMTRIGYSITTDMIMRTPVEDIVSQRHGTTFDNFGRSRIVSAMANYRRQIGKIWTANLYVQGSYVINTSNEASGEFVNKGGMLVVQLNNNITITPTLSAELTGLYVSRMHRGYFVIEPQGNFSIGLRQMLLKNKMTLSLTINDIFYTYKDKMRAQYESVDYTLAYKRDSRYVSLTLRYNFGSSTVRAARNKSTGIEDEASRAGGR
jgi:hypothetical protein